MGAVRHAGPYRQKLDRSIDRTERRADELRSIVAERTQWFADHPDAAARLAYLDQEVHRIDGAQRMQERLTRLVEQAIEPPTPTIERGRGIERGMGIDL